MTREMYTYHKGVCQIIIINEILKYMICGDILPDQMILSFYLKYNVHQYLSNSMK